ncbi:ribonuclease E/G [Asticcacaulis sp. BYS171W]|uniref:Ribonuclease E/G n=1 Tax=Asticcacaulis aquaticus TaxID=2984212 RepID=A0ABT5HVA1_9CAUL|nr:ribonuclease E/G [Asticcacaulis aquaticus]MDC7683873.1 ribonuclease E/G [Asticcacaulis aquaticus]
MKLFYEARFGLARACVVQNGQPWLYAEGRVDDPSLCLWGVRSVARLTAKTGGVGFLKLADGSEAMLDLPKDVTLNEGAAIEVEIAAEARAEKRPRARYIGPGDTPRRVSTPLDLKGRLMAQARHLIDPKATFDLIEGEDAIDALDIAEAQALNPSTDLPDGAFLTIEPTRALIACDVDLGGAGEGLARAPKQAIKATNERALSEVARRLRLANLAGLVVVDLIGSKHNGEKLTGILRDAFATEGPRIISGPITRFGTYEFTRPWGAAPINDPGTASLRAARRLLWQAVAEARSDAGAMFILRAPQLVASVVRQCLKDSLDPLSPRLSVEVVDRADATVVRAR